MKKDIPVPQEGAGRYFFLLKNHFWTLCKLNLLMLAASLPIVTIPAALCAGDRAAVKLARDGYVLLWEEFRDEFREDFWKSLPLGLLFGGLLAGSYVLLSFGLGNSGSLPGMLMLALGILLAWYAFSRGKLRLPDAGYAAPIQWGRFEKCRNPQRHTERPGLGGPGYGHWRGFADLCLLSLQPAPFGNLWHGPVPVQLVLFSQ